MSSQMEPMVGLTGEHRSRVEEFRQRHRTGVLTLLFTDMVGSTGVKQALGDAAGTALVREQQELVRGVLAGFSEAEEISTAGDSFFIVFIRPSDAVRFALQLQARLAARNPAAPPIALRVGAHMGEVFVQAEERDGARDILGIQVDTASRVMSLAAGRQILMTRAVFDNARAVLRGEELSGVGSLSWLDHGDYRIKGVEQPLAICEVGEEGRAPLSAPANSAKAFRYISPDQEPVLGWRPALDHTVPGTQWLLDEKLGEGGFGEVWRAWHPNLRRHHVFKFCFRAERVRSLKREVAFFRLLTERVGEHPGIVRLFDVYFDEPPYYIVMEYVPGKDLVGWCKARGGAQRVSLETRLEIVAQAADALQAAHESGVIHRDIKPANILIEESHPPGAPHAKLTDFGIGQVVSREVLEGRSSEGFTETVGPSTFSSRAGTQLYMAPEVLAGGASSTRSDLYSLGIVLYQLIVGDFRRPVTTDWEREIADALLVEDLRRCFAGRPEERYGSAAELAESLRSLPRRRRERQQLQATQRLLARRKRLLQVMAPAAALLLGLAIFLGIGMQRARHLQRATEEARADLERQERRTRATLELAERHFQETQRALFSSSLLNDVLRTADHDVSPMLERFYATLMQPVRSRLGMVQDVFVPELWQPAPAWPGVGAEEMEWVNRQDVLSPVSAFETRVVLVVSNPQGQSGTLRIRAVSGGPPLAESGLEASERLGYIALSTAAMKTALALEFDAGGPVRELGRISALAASRPPQPRVRLLFSPCELALRHDVPREMSESSAGFNQAVLQHLEQHPYELRMVHPYVNLENEAQLRQAITENVLTALRHDAFLAWAGEETPGQDGEMLKAAVINLWNGEIAFEGVFDISRPERIGEAIAAFCQKCEAVLYREFPAFVARVSRLVPEGGIIALPLGVNPRVGTNLTVYRPDVDGELRPVIHLKVRRIVGEGVEAWETERSTAAPLAVGELVASEWTAVEDVRAALTAAD